MPISRDRISAALTLAAPYLTPADHARTVERIAARTCEDCGKLQGVCSCAPSHIHPAVLRTFAHADHDFINHPEDSEACAICGHPSHPYGSSAPEPDLICTCGLRAADCPAYAAEQPGHEDAR